MVEQGRDLPCSGGQFIFSLHILATLVASIEVWCWRICSRRVLARRYVSSPSQSASRLGLARVAVSPKGHRAYRTKRWSQASQQDYPVDLSSQDRLNNYQSKLVTCGQTARRVQRTVTHRRREFRVSRGNLGGSHPIYLLGLKLNQSKCVEASKTQPIKMRRGFKKS